MYYHLTCMTEMIDNKSNASKKSRLINIKPNPYCFIYSNLIKFDWRHLPTTPRKKGFQNEPVK